MTLLILFILMLIFAPWMFGIVLMIPLMILGLFIAVITSPIFWLSIMFLALLGLIFN